MLIVVNNASTFQVRQQRAEISSTRRYQRQVLAQPAPPRRRSRGLRFGLLVFHVAGNMGSGD